MSSLPYPSANLGCRSETCCGSLEMQATNSPKIRHLRTIVQLCTTMSLKVRYFWKFGKNSWNSNISSRCPHNLVNFGPLTAEIWWRVWGTQANFNRLAYCSDVAHRRPSKLCMMFGRLLGIMYKFSWALALYGMLPFATLRPSPAFSYIGSVTAGHSSSGRRKKNVFRYPKYFFRYQKLFSRYPE